MTDRTAFPNYYEILGIQTDASPVIIKQRYRELALQCHPDKTNNKETEEFVKINRAFKVLSNPNLKHLYDLQYVASMHSNITFHDCVSLDDLEVSDSSFVMNCRCGGAYELSKDAVEISVPAIVVCCNTCSLGISVEMTENR